MRAMVTDHPGDFDVMRARDVAVPTLGPREVLVRNYASGVCYHDHLIRVGVMKRGITFPLILGHEGAGIVQEVGAAVRSLRRGDRVACTQWTENCGLCRYCRTNREPLCSERKLFGHDRDGTFADEVRRLARGEGVDVVCDNVGAPVFQEALRATARGARYVLVGELTGETVTFNTARLFLKGVSLLSTTSTSRAQLADVIELVRQHKLRPIVTERFPLGEAPRVHRLMVDRKLSGRVVLLP